MLTLDISYLYFVFIHLFFILYILQYWQLLYLSAMGLWLMWYKWLGFNLEFLLSKCQVSILKPQMRYLGSTSPYSSFFYIFNLHGAHAKCGKGEICFFSFFFFVRGSATQCCNNKPTRILPVILAIWKYIWMKKKDYQYLNDD